MAVLVGTDFSEGAKAALRVGAALARATGERLILATVVAPVAGLETAGLGEDLLSSESRVAGLALEREARSLGEPAPEARLMVGEPARALGQLAEEVAARLVVVGSHGRGALGRLVLGSVADRLVRKLERPVLVVREPTERLEAWLGGRTELRALAALDLDDTAPETLAALEALRKQGPCAVTVAHVYPVVSTYDRMGFEEGPALAQAAQENAEARSRAVGSAVADLAGAGQVDVVVEPRWGPPGAVLRRIAENTHPDLVVVGTHGRHGLSRWVRGSVAEDLVHHLGSTLLCARGCPGARRRAAPPAASPAPPAS